MSVCLSVSQFCKLLVFLFTTAVAPDFSNSVLKAQTLARQGGDVLIECRPRMSPRGMISWRKGKEALRESHRYFYQPISLCLPRTNALLKWYRRSNMIQVRRRVVTDQRLDYSHQNVSTQQTLHLHLLDLEIKKEGKKEEKKTEKRQQYLNNQPTTDHSNCGF